MCKTFLSVLGATGMVPVTIRPPHPQNISTTLPTVKMISEVSKSVAILTNGVITKMLKTKVRRKIIQHFLPTFLMGPFTLSVSVNAAMTLATWLSLKWMETKRVAPEWGFQWETCYKRHRGADADTWCKRARRKLFILVTYMHLTRPHGFVLHPFCY